MVSNKKHVITDKCSGFSLVEVMIVVAILAILGTIAIPLYRNYITAGKQSSAESVLEQFPILLENFRAENGSFPATGTYTYKEAADGSVTSNTIKSAAGANLTDFAPKSSTSNDPVMFDYTLQITNSGTANEAATFTATGVRDAAGINVTGSYQ